MELTINLVKQNGWLVYEVIAGSKAYGLNNAASDTDIRGVYILPADLYYGFDQPLQVSNDTNDIVYYELKRFMELLAKNNPNIIELLNVPEACVLYKHPLMNLLKPELFLSKLCEQTFANYAFTQIKKAYGLEKKILNPVEQKRKSVLDFCFVYSGKRSVPVQEYLFSNGWKSTDIGLSSIDHLRGCYNMYYSKENAYAGIIRKQESNDVVLSSISKTELPVALLYFNKDGYSVYCKKYQEYWEWVTKRNDTRYQNTLSHGKNYDSKNMMHVFRLLLMAREIAIDGQINVYRHDRDFLLAIKAGEYEYSDLVKKAGQLRNELPALYKRSELPDTTDIAVINALLVTIRKTYYSNN